MRLGPPSSRRGPLRRGLPWRARRPASTPRIPRPGASWARPSPPGPQRAGLGRVRRSRAPRPGVAGEPSGLAGHRRGRPQGRGLALSAADARGRDRGLYRRRGPCEGAGGGAASALAKGAHRCPSGRCGAEGGGRVLNGRPRPGTAATSRTSCPCTPRMRPSFRPPADARPAGGVDRYRKRYPDKAAMARYRSGAGTASRAAAAASSRIGRGARTLAYPDNPRPRAHLAGAHPRGAGWPSSRRVDVTYWFSPIPTSTSLSRTVRTRRIKKAAPLGSLPRPPRSRSPRPRSLFGRAGIEEVGGRGRQVRIDAGRRDASICRGEAWAASIPARSPARAARRASV